MRLPTTYKCNISHYATLCTLAILAGWSLTMVFLLACGEDFSDAVVPVATWRMEQHVQPYHPLIVSWSKDVRSITSKDIEQVAVAEQAVWHLVRYWDAYDTWGSNGCIPSIDEMIILADKKSWGGLRGNCVSQSIILCSLLRSLGFKAYIKTTSRHSWVECVADGKVIDLLYPDAGVTSADAYLPTAHLDGTQSLAARRLGADSSGVFPQIPLLPETNRRVPLFVFPTILWLYIPLLWLWRKIFSAWDTKRLSAAARNKSPRQRASYPLIGYRLPIRL